MPIPLRDVKILWGRAAGRCSICKKVLVPYEYPRTVLGEMAHIKGERPDAARYGASMSEEDRNSYDNLILLSRDCHKLVDDAPADWTVDRLKKVKGEHEAWVRSALRAREISRSELRKIKARVQWGRRFFLPGTKPRAVFETIDLQAGKPTLCLTVFNPTRDLLVVSQISLERLFRHELEAPSLSGLAERVKEAEFVVGAPAMVGRPPVRTKLVVHLADDAVAARGPDSLHATYDLEGGDAITDPTPRQIAIHVPPGEAHSIALTLLFDAEYRTGFVVIVEPHLLCAKNDGTRDILLGRTFEISRLPGSRTLEVRAHGSGLRNVFPNGIKTAPDAAAVSARVTREPFSDIFVHFTVTRVLSPDQDSCARDELLAWFLERVSESDEEAERSTVWHDAFIRVLKATSDESARSPTLKPLWQGVYDSKCQALYRLCAGRVMAGLPLKPQLRDAAAAMGAAAEVADGLLRYCEEVLKALPTLGRGGEEVLQGRVEAIVTAAEIGGERSIRVLLIQLFRSRALRYDTGRAFEHATGTRFGFGPPAWVAWCEKRVMSLALAMLGLTVLSTFIAPVIIVWLSSSGSSWSEKAGTWADWCAWIFVGGLGATLGLAWPGVMVLRVARGVSWRTAMRRVRVWWREQQATRHWTPWPAGEGGGERFELNEVIEADPGWVFAAFSDPRALCRAAGARPPEMETEGPISEGTAWSSRGTFRFKTRSVVVRMEPPHCIVRDISGSVTARVEDHFEGTPTGTKVRRSFVVKRVPLYSSFRRYRLSQQQFLSRIKSSLESKRDVGASRAASGGGR